MALQFSNKGMGRLYLKYLKAYSAVRSGAQYVVSAVDEASMIVIVHAVEDARVVNEGGDPAPGLSHPYTFPEFKPKLDDWFLGLENAVDDDTIT